MFLAMCVSVCMRKGSRNSQYLSEISAWNHDRPDLSSVMEPDRVSSGFSTQTPHKPQSKSTKERERERQTERAQEQFGISRSSHYHATAFQHQRERKKGCGKNQGDGIKVLQTEWENMPTGTSHMGPLAVSLQESSTADRSVNKQCGTSERCAQDCVIVLRM